MADTNLNTNVSTPARPDMHKEIPIRDEEWFDLQPIEQKLCGYSFGLGIALLFLFIFVFEIFH